MTGEFGRLAVIDSASIQELPRTVWEMIRRKIVETGITEFICESYWEHRGRFAEVREFFGVPTRITIGVETFDHDLRNRVLNKNMHFDSPRDVAAVTNSVCLIVGFKGQTHDSVRRDLDILFEHFTYGCVNLLTPNVKNAALVDDAIKDWFRREYAWLNDHPTVEVLWRNTDFGVG